MTERYVFGTPFDTEAVLDKPMASTKKMELFEQNGNSFTMEMGKNDIVYGLGENVRGINKRGFVYESFCSDQFDHTEDRSSLYGAHNFFIIDGDKKTGVFVDSPGRVRFDIGYTDCDKIAIEVENDGYEIYIIEENSLEAVVQEFRKLIGKSYVPPKWAFGAGQSRWGYGSEADLKKVAEGYRSNHIPLDMIYLDIDYMDNFKDFTVDKSKYSDFGKTVAELKKDNLRVIPIIDAGIKIEDGYDIYEEGKEKNYFCKDENGEDFVVGVWPGRCVLPDVLNKDAREWFGEKYKILTDAGIEGFWNDMNEPALFYSEKNKEKVFEKLGEYKDKNVSIYDNFAMKDAVNYMANNIEDYKSFWHRTKDGNKRHDTVHNLYGYNLTRSASEKLEEFKGKGNFLLFSRASYIGMHRYSGIWMGDNKSWWSHILLNLKMLPSLNMCGFLYTGADTGGFGCNATEDLVLRWYELSIFMPLLRNHSSLGTREQEPYQFKKSLDLFRGILSLRYRLIPYIHASYMDAAESNSMYARPLGFVWNDDEDARRCEDQLMIGESIMIAPVYEQNAIGRHVYLPEDMKMIRFKGDRIVETEVMKRGHGYIYSKLDEVVVFLRKGKTLPLAKACECVDDIDWNNMEETISF